MSVPTVEIKRKSLFSDGAAASEEGKKQKVDSKLAEKEAEESAQSEDRTEKASCVPPGKAEDCTDLVVDQSEPSSQELPSTSASSQQACPVGCDPEVWRTLPDSIKDEIVDSAATGGGTESAGPPAAGGVEDDTEDQCPDGYDKDVFNQLPADIRRELTMGSGRHRNAGITNNISNLPAAGKSRPVGKGKTPPGMKGKKKMISKPVQSSILKYFKKD